MIGAMRSAHAESINRMAAQARSAIDGAQDQIARLKRDMADPSQPERASDITRLMRERDEARTALSAVEARAQRLQASVDQMADGYEKLVSRITRAESMLRQQNAA